MTALAAYAIVGTTFGIAVRMESGAMPVLDAVLLAVLWPVVVAMWIADGCP